VRRRLTRLGYGRGTTHGQKEKSLGFQINPHSSEGTEKCRRTARTAREIQEAIRLNC